MKKLFFAALSVLCITACTPGIPDNVLKPDEMEKVLFDIHIVDGYLTTIPYQDSAKKVGAPYYKGIYKKFGIDSAKYARSMTYYYKHPEDLSKIYTKVVAALEKTKKDLDKPKYIKKEQNAVPQ